MRFSFEAIIGSKKIQEGSAEFQDIRSLGFTSMEIHITHQDNDVDQWREIPMQRLTQKATRVHNLQVRVQGSERFLNTALLFNREFYGQRGANIHSQPTKLQPKLLFHQNEIAGTKTGQTKLLMKVPLFLNVNMQPDQFISLHHFQHDILHFSKFEFIIFQSYAFLFCHVDLSLVEVIFHSV